MSLQKHVQVFFRPVAESPSDGPIETGALCRRVYLWRRFPVNGPKSQCQVGALCNEGSSLEGTPQHAGALEGPILTHLAFQFPVCLRSCPGVTCVDTARGIHIG